MPPPIMASHAPVYNHLPAHLAQQYAALLQQSSVAPAPQLAPAPEMHYHHLPPDLAQKVANLPLLIQQPVRGRGRGRGRGNITTAAAPLPFAQIAAQYAALQSVCFILLF